MGLETDRAVARPKVVALGGGHGLHAMLSALVRLPVEVTAVVTVADDGGSSGRLRHEPRRGRVALQHQKQVVLQTRLQLQGGTRDETVRLHRDVSRLFRRPRVPDWPQPAHVRRSEGPVPPNRI